MRTDKVEVLTRKLNSGHPLFVEPEMSERIAKGASGDRARRCPYALRKSKLPDFMRKTPVFKPKTGVFLMILTVFVDRSSVKLVNDF